MSLKPEQKYGPANGAATDSAASAQSRATPPLSPSRTEHLLARALWHFRQARLLLGEAAKALYGKPNS